MKRYLYWSGGKDSSASIVLCYQNGIHLDGVVMSEVMFDHERGISGENPMHIKWVYEIAIPIIENVFGYKVIILKDKMDYIQEFYHKITRSKKEERVGKYTGFFIGGMCVGNRDLKMRPIKQFAKSVGEHIQIVGIAADEPKRLARLGKNKRSILAELGIVEEQTYEICRAYSLLSPTYNDKNRGGCWFCPNQGYKEFATLKKEYPNLWEELKVLSKSDNLASKNFKYGETFEQVEKKIDFINSQLSIFDFMEG
jgi:hypothetical protein